MVIGSVLIPGAKAPKLVSNELVSRMKLGSVLVDIAVDQGGCFADSRPTTHADSVLALGLNTFGGTAVNANVAEAHGLTQSHLEDALR